MIEPASAGESFCYLTTFGRITGRRHRIEIWFAAVDDTVYLLSGGGTRSDWVRNVSENPDVEVEIAGTTFTGSARLVIDDSEQRTARRVVYEKYQPTYGGDLTGWREESLPVAVDLA